MALFLVRHEHTEETCPTAPSHYYLLKIRPQASQRESRIENSLWMHIRLLRPSPFEQMEFTASMSPPTTC